MFNMGELAKGFGAAKSVVANGQADGIVQSFVGAAQSLKDVAECMLRIEALLQQQNMLLNLLVERNHE